MTTKRFFTRQCFLESRPGGNNNGRGPCGVWRLQRTSGQEHAKIQRRALGSFNVSTPADKDDCCFPFRVAWLHEGTPQQPAVGLPRFERHSRFGKCLRVTLSPAILYVEVGKCFSPCTFWAISPHHDGSGWNSTLEIQPHQGLCTLCLTQHPPSRRGEASQLRSRRWLRCRGGVEHAGGLHNWRRLPGVHQVLGHSLPRPQVLRVSGALRSFGACLKPSA